MDDSIVSFDKREEAYGWIHDRKNPELFNIAYFGSDERYHVFRRLDEVVILPPKKYTFTEAYQMMKTGKMMIPCSYKSSGKLIGILMPSAGVFNLKYHDSADRADEEMSISLLEEQWEEVQP